MLSNHLPNEQQRKQLNELLGAAFVELRGINDQSKQVHDLAYAFHNLPLTMHGWGTWNWERLRKTLANYRAQYPQGGPDYAAMLDAIQSDSKPANPTRKILWQQIEIETPELLTKCVGLKGQAWAYMTGHGQLLVRFYESGSWNGIYLFCKGCDDVHFQSSWPNANVSVEILVGKYGREYLITDGERLRIQCHAAFLAEYDGYLQFSDMYADEIK